MLKKLLLLCALLLCCAGCGRKAAPAVSVHTASYPGWVEVTAGDAARFAVPPDLTVWGREDQDQLLKAPGLDPLVKRWLEESVKTSRTPGCVIVQNGKIAPVPWKDNRKYAWVEFKTLPSPEPLPKYGQNLGLTGSEIQDFGQITQAGMEKAANQKLPDGYALRFRDWQPMASTIINGVESLHTAFACDILQNGSRLMTLHGERWVLFNLDRLHTLTVVWNEADTTYWQDDARNLNHIINTLQITPSQGKEK